MDKEVFDTEVIVRTPFSFCKKCERMRIGEVIYHLWASDDSVVGARYCENGNFCRSIIELYKEETKC